MPDAQIGIACDADAALRPGVQSRIVSLERHAERRFFRPDVSPDIHGHTVGQERRICVQVSLYVERQVSVFDLEGIERQVRYGSQDRTVFRGNFDGLRGVQDQLVFELDGHGDRGARFIVGVGDVLRKGFLENVDRGFVERVQFRSGFDDEGIFQPADRLIRFQHDLSSGNDGRHRHVVGSFFPVGLERQQVFQFRKFTQRTAQERFLFCVGKHFAELRLVRRISEIEAVFMIEIRQFCFRFCDALLGDPAAAHALLFLFGVGELEIRVILCLAVFPEFMVNRFQFHLHRLHDVILEIFVFFSLNDPVVLKPLFCGIFLRLELRVEFAAVQNVTAGDLNFHVPGTGLYLFHIKRVVAETFPVGFSHFSDRNVS